MSARTQDQQTVEETEKLTDILRIPEAVNYPSSSPSAFNAKTLIYIIILLLTNIISSSITGVSVGDKCAYNQQPVIVYKALSDKWTFEERKNYSTNFTHFTPLLSCLDNCHIDFGNGTN